MKSLQNIKDQINDLKDLHKKETFISEKQKKQYNKKIAFLRDCQYYLEFKPTVEYLEKEAKRLGLLIESINTRVEHYFKNSKTVKAIKKEYEFTKISDQLKTINYLLNDKK